MSVRARKLVSFDADKPEDWRVSFRCIATSGRRLPAGIPAFQRPQACERQNTACRQEAGGPKTERRFHFAWPIAERFEALLRVYNNPAPYARRLARRLRALPRLIARVLQTPADFEHRIDEDTRTQLSAHLSPLKPDSS